MSFWTHFKSNHLHDALNKYSVFKQNAFQNTSQIILFLLYDSVFLITTHIYVLMLVQFYLYLASYYLVKCPENR